MTEKYIPANHNEVPRLSPDEFIEPLVYYTTHVRQNIDGHITDFGGPYALRHEHSILMSSHPELAKRGAHMSHIINQGFSSDDAKCPDAKNYENCFIIGYGLMRHAYEHNGRILPEDIVQSPWFDDPQMKESIHATFDGINMSQLIIVEKYEAFAAALVRFVNTTDSAQGTHFATGCATLAAAEIYDAFEQMEAVRD